MTKHFDHRGSVCKYSIILLSLSYRKPNTEHPNTLVEVLKSTCQYLQHRRLCFWYESQSKIQIPILLNSMSEFPYLVFISCFTVLLQYGFTVLNRTPKTDTSALVCYYTFSGPAYISVVAGSIPAGVIGIFH